MSEIGERVKKIVVEHLGVEPEKVVDNASFIDDLGADSLDDDLLRFQPSGLDLLLLLGESLGSGFSVGLCAFDCLFERLLTRFDSGGDLRENKLPEDGEENHEGDESPEHEPAIGRKKIPGLGGFFGRYVLEECEDESRHGCVVIRRIESAAVCFA